MEIEKLKEQLKNNQVPKFLILNVDNYALCRNYLKRIEKIQNKKIGYYDDGNQVLYEIATDLIEEKIYVILYDEKIVKNEKYIEELKATNKNIILYYSGLDKKSEFYKHNQKDIVEIEKLEEYKLIEYFEKKLNKENIILEIAKLRQIINNCNNDLGCCENELDKIINLWYINRELYKDYIENNKFPDYREIKTFEYTRNIVKGVSVEDFGNIKKIEDNTVTFLILLQKNAINLFNRTKDKRLIKIIKLSEKLNEKIIEGKINSKYVLDYLLLKLI